jgi:hypothetical protein
MGRFKVTVTRLDDAKDQPGAPVQCGCVGGPELVRRPSPKAPSEPAAQSLEASVAPLADS